MKYIFYLLLIILFAIGCKKVKDVDGNVYPTTKIGSQKWMTKNLDVSRYRNGDPIPQVQNIDDWYNANIGAWCYYEFNSENGPIYGKLYNWYAVNDPRGLAPEGWHVPTHQEILTLFNYCGGDSLAGGKLKSTGFDYWKAPNEGATNETGFNALGAGATDYPSFSGLRDYAGFWCSDNADDGTGDPYSFGMHYDRKGAWLQPDFNKTGYTIRCIKD
jgi:uncharacterized protein (TIGR02145 family)